MHHLPSRLTTNNLYAYDLHYCWAYTRTITDATSADPHSPGVFIVNITTFNYSSAAHQPPQSSLPQALVRVRVSESAAEGQLLLSARARDPDVGENARVLYELDPDAPAVVLVKFEVGTSSPPVSSTHLQYGFTQQVRVPYPTPHFETIYDNDKPTVS